MHSHPAAPFSSLADALGGHPAILPEAEIKQYLGAARYFRIDPRALTAPMTKISGWRHQHRLEFWHVGKDGKRRPGWRLTDLFAREPGAHLEDADKPAFERPEQDSAHFCIDVRLSSLWLDVLPSSPDVA